MTQIAEDGEKDSGQKKKRHPFWNTFKWFLLGIVILWVSVIILIQIPAVQSYLIDRITNSLSEKTGTKVEVDRFNFQMFNAITLDGVFVQDYDQDTLFYAERFKLKFENPILTFLRNRMFELNGLSIVGAKFNLDRDPLDSMTNLQRFLTHFKQRDTLVLEEENQAFPFELKLDELIIRNTSFQRKDSLYGVYQNYYIYQALLNPSKLDIKGNHFELENADIDSLSIHIANFEPQASDSLLEITDDRPPPKTQNPLHLAVRNLNLTNSHFQQDNFARSPVKQSPSNVLDWDHFTVNDIDINISDFQFDDWVFTGCLDKLNGYTNSGFEITDLHSGFVTVDSTHVVVNDALLKTPFSNWALDIHLKYSQFEDFKSYVDEVVMEIDSREGNIAIEDIITFAPGLADVRFFNENRRETIKLKGFVDGTVNDLNGEDILLQIGTLTFMEGHFSSRNLAHPENTLLNLEIESSRTRMRELRKLIPGFNPPPNFNKLGLIKFSGRFDGFYKDFVAFGSMSSAIGRAELDMRMNLNQEFEKAEYSGQLNLIAFDLGRWTDNQDFGLVNFNADVSQGKGLTLKDLEASIEATIRELSYKDYTYENFTVNGEFEKTSFEGYFNIEDENVDLSFIGRVDLSKELPLIDLDAEVEAINFKNINITEEAYKLSGQFDLAISNYNLDKLEAEALVKNVLLVENDSLIYRIDSLYALSKYDGMGSRSIRIQSDMLEASISGNYRLDHLWPTLRSEISQYYPSFTEKLGWSNDTTITSNQNFTANIDIHRSGNWPSLFDKKLDSLTDSNVKVIWDNTADSFILDAYTPSLHYGEHEFFDAYVYVRSFEGKSNIVLGVDSAMLQDRFSLQATTVFADIAKDTLFWTLNAANYDSLLDNFNFQGKTYIKDNYWTSSLANEYLQLFNEKWYISPKNAVQIDSHFINIENFSMHNQDRIIYLRSIENKGIMANLEGVQLGLLNDILAYDKLKYAGWVNASVSKSDVFKNSALEAEVFIDSLYINDDRYGHLNLSLNAATARSALDVDGEIADSTKSLNFSGELFASNSGTTADFYDVNLKLNNYPLKILEYFIGDNISKTEGVLTGQFDLSGKLDKPVLNGEAILTDGAVTINFLGTRIFVDSQYVRSLENELDVTGAIIQDKYGNTAELNGGLVHNYFTDLGLDFRLVTDNFLLLNTTREDQSTYYGHCLGSAQVDMFGRINAPNINVVAENNPNTQFYLKTDVSGEEVQAGFFRYEDLSDTGKAVVQTLDAPKGVNLYLDLTANESAEVSIIIDQNTGDIIKGRGSGNIQFYLNPAGEIEMFGNYSISTGEYLFTAQTLINKTFRVASGSMIRWTGDPFAALIDIKATYDVVTSPLFFVDDMVVEDPQLISQLEDQTEVILVVNLTGYLYSPELGFDLRFPNLTGTAETVVENKLALLEGNPSEMYDHAGALIVFNSFIPSEAGLGGSISVAAGINTISEFLTNQFSRLFSSLLRSAVADLGFIEDIDFDLTYDVAVGLGNIEANDNFTLEGGEFKLRTSARLFERVELDLGGNYGVGNSTLGTTESGTYFTGNFAIQYALTEDRKLVLRVYSATDRVLEGRRFRSGVGIRYQQEFDSFSNFFEGLKKAIQKGTSIN